jgi:hypothetical protein
MLPKNKQTHTHTKCIETHFKFNVEKINHNTQDLNFKKYGLERKSQILIEWLFPISVKVLSFESKSETESEIRI